MNERPALTLLFTPGRSDLSDVLHVSFGTARQRYYQENPIDGVFGCSDLIIMVGEIWNRILETGGSDRIFPSSDYMYQLTYRFLSRPGPDLGDLDDILEEAIATNSARNISGYLVHHHTRYVQILEGSKKDVLHMSKRIPGR